MAAVIDYGAKERWLKKKQTIGYKYFASALLFYAMVQSEVTSLRSFRDKDAYLNGKECK